MKVRPLARSLPLSVILATLLGGVSHAQIVQGQSTSPSVTVDMSVIQELGPAPNVADMLLGTPPRAAAPVSRAQRPLSVPKAEMGTPRFPVISRGRTLPESSRIALQPPKAASGQPVLRTPSRRVPVAKATPRSPAPRIAVAAPPPKRSASALPTRLKPPAPPASSSPVPPEAKRQAPVAQQLSSRPPSPTPQSSAPPPEVKPAPPQTAALKPPPPPPIPALSAKPPPVPPAPPPTAPAPVASRPDVSPSEPKAPESTASTSASASKVAMVPAVPRRVGPIGNGTAFSIGFNAGSATLKPDANSGLKRLADAMKTDEALRVQLLAYASAQSGSVSQARRLSLSRALAARSSLIDKGVKSTRIDVRALGNKSESGPADRIDIIVTRR